MDEPVWRRDGPRFVEWQGKGPLPELALSLNVRRRHLGRIVARLGRGHAGEVDGKGSAEAQEPTGCKTWAGEEHEIENQPVPVMSRRITAVAASIAPLAVSEPA